MIADQSSNRDDDPGEQLKKIKLVEDAQLSFFIIIHIYGKPDPLYPLEELKARQRGGPEFTLPFDTRVKDSGSLGEKQWFLR
jgi:hypothetical protein